MNKYNHCSHSNFSLNENTEKMSLCHPWVREMFSWANVQWGSVRWRRVHWGYILNPYAYV